MCLGAAEEAPLCSSPPRSGQVRESLHNHLFALFRLLSTLFVRTTLTA